MIVKLLFHLQMVSNYKRKTTRGSWTFEAPCKAKRAVSCGLSLRAAAERYQVPRQTLHRRMRTDSLSKSLGRFRPVFSADQEELLAQHLKAMDWVFFGLTIKSLRALAFEFAERNRIAHPFSNSMAGVGWVNGFMARHPELSVRAPEATSIARATGFNRPQVDRFFGLLRSLYLKHNLQARDIYNCDETGLQTSANRPPKVISVKGKRQVCRPRSSKTSNKVQRIGGRPIQYNVGMVD